MCVRFPENSKRLKFPRLLRTALFKWKPSLSPSAWETFLCCLGCTHFLLPKVSQSSSGSALFTVSPLQFPTWHLPRLSLHLPISCRTPFPYVTYFLELVTLENSWVCNAYPVCPKNDQGWVCINLHGPDLIGCLLFEQQKTQLLKECWTGQPSGMCDLVSDKNTCYKKHYWNW